MSGAGARDRVAAALPPGEEARWFRAPGRVNLIGEHTDYNEGLVLPFAVDRSCVVAARPAASVRIRSLDSGDAVEIPADGSADAAGIRPAWGRYVGGVVRELAALGRAHVGIDAVLASDVPLGAGLSSSAALEVAVATALCDAAGLQPGPLELAEACRRAEEVATGVPCGIMDQLTSVCGVEGHALLVDCRSLELRQLALPPALGVLVVHSGTSRALDASGYADRRRECELLARRLGLRALRDAAWDEVADEPLGRHVVSENARVLEAASALERGDPELLGRLTSESHASLRDDFRVSTPELDALVEELERAGALGARLMGGGFGGCAVAVCEASRAGDVAWEATAAYAARTGREPWALQPRAVAGAGQLQPAEA